MVKNLKKKERWQQSRILPLLAMMGALFMVQQFSLGMQASKRLRSLSATSRQDKIVMQRTVGGDTTTEQARWTKYRSLYQYKPPATVPALVEATSAGTTNWQQSAECITAPDFLDYFQLPLKVRSRNDEDRIIYHTFFKDNLSTLLQEEAGTYVELGAFDGRIESNSRFFDACLGWKGLLIEGNPDSYKKLVNNRPNAHRMSFAPSCSAEYEATNRTVQFAKYPMTNAGLKGKAKTYDQKPMVDVPCGPLGPVLQDVFEGQSINFLSLDVEGAEPMVLETIDFDKVKIHVLMVEVQNTFCGAECKSREETRAIMKRAGYLRYENIVVASDVYVHPNSPFRLPPGSAYTPAAEES